MPSHTTPAKLLVVDDSVTVRLSLRDVFIGQGYEVLLAGGGEEALRLLRSEAVDILVLDLVMPDKSGMDVLREVKADEDLASIPVILLTAVADRKELVACLDLGAEEFIVKPWDTCELLARLRSMVRLKRANDAARDSEARVRALLNAPSEVSILINRDGVVLACNDPAATMLGTTAKELEGRCLFDLLSARRRDGWKRYIHSVIHTARPVHFEDKRDGTIFHTGVYPVGEGRGETAGCAIVSQDITHRKRAEEALRESEAKFRTISAAAHDAIIMMDNNGNISYWNAAAQVIFGYAEEEALGKNVHTLLAPARFHEAHSRAFPRFQATGQGAAVGNTLELAAIRKNGEEFPMEMSVSAVQSKGKWHAIGILRDITHRKRAEERMRIAQEAAEAANRAKSEFLANMSHEIRTPMTAILGFSNVLFEEAACCTECPAHAKCEKRQSCREAVETIRRNGDYLLNIIDDILDLSKIEAGKMSVERIRCSPCRIVAEVASLARTRADAKGLLFKFEYAGPVPETIQTDPTRLRQILINIIGNAIKFTEVGNVRLVTRFVEDDHEPRLQFDVVDTGLGMTEEQVPGLFQPFTQADASTTREFGGTGLGLAISKRLAELLGGDVAVVQTQPGAGTRFRVTISVGPLDGVNMINDPMSATVLLPDTAHATAGPDQPLLHDCRILLAEDGPDNQRLIAHVLKKAGADVTVVENGRLAADAVLAGGDKGPGGPGFDVILMDMQMPVMDGYAATRLLRRKGYAGPIIALTAHAMVGDRAKCINAGCDAYATKPIDCDKLIDAVRAQINSHAPVGSPG